MDSNSGFNRTAQVARLVATDGEQSGPEILLFPDFTWTYRSKPVGTVEKPAFPKKYVRHKDFTIDAFAQDLQSIFGGKRYSNLNEDEKRIYNRLKKQASDRRKRATPEGCQLAREQGLRRLRKYYQKLRIEGKISDHYRKIAQHSRRRRARRKIEPSAS